MPNQPDYYTLLNLKRDAVPEDIRRAYFSAARRLHPDKGGSTQDIELFILIQGAYQVLSNPKKRSEYDATLPSEKTSESPLISRVQYSRPSIPHVTEPQLMYALIEFSSVEDSKEQVTPPLNLCLVLDRSTSMQGQSMDKVKATAIELIRRLRDSDIISVVAFSDRAETIIPSTRTNDPKKLEARIQMLQPSGGTEIFQGLSSGYQEIQHGKKDSQISHILLLTDGRTYGDENECLKLAKKAIENGIAISGLGIGSEWNDDFLDQLASITGGSSLYISKPQDIQRILIEKFNKLWNVFARDSLMEFKLGEGVDLRYAFRIQPEVGLLPIDSPLRLGAILKGTALKVLVEFMVRPHGNHARNIRLLEGRLKASLSSQPALPISIPVRLSRPVTDSVNWQTPPEEILRAISSLSLYRLQEQARREVSAGKFKEASQRLQRLAAHLLEQGQRGLARTALLEADHIQQKKKFTQEGEKLIKYGTRALLQPSPEEVQP